MWPPCAHGLQPTGPSTVCTAIFWCSIRRAGCVCSSTPTGRCAPPATRLWPKPWPPANLWKHSAPQTYHPMAGLPLSIRTLSVPRGQLNRWACSALFLIWTARWQTSFRAWPVLHRIWSSCCWTTGARHLPAAIPVLRPWAAPMPAPRQTALPSAPLAAAPRWRFRARQKAIRGTKASRGKLMYCGPRRAPLPAGSPRRWTLPLYAERQVFLPS